TQHIGAYVVDLPKGKITFLDTPGHEAFTAMRARGSKVTDVAVIVVSAADGVMPQTLESIAHAKAAGVPVIVAINKMDLPEANPQVIKNTLAGNGLTPEEWGGDTIYVNVSAKTGLGIDQLLESILLQSELGELRAHYDVPARGTVIESRLDKNRGPIATVLIQHGILKPGDMVVSGLAMGKVRAMVNPLGQKAIQVGPSEPGEILGLSEVPAVGEDIFSVADEKTAKQIVDLRSGRARDRMVARPKVSLEEVMTAPVTEEREVRIVLKTDVQGSAEALKEALTKLPQEKVKLKTLHSGCGGITETDVMLAAASGGFVLGFNVRPDVNAQKVAENAKVSIKTFNIIYDLLEAVKKLLEGMLSMQTHEKVIGRAEVRNLFSIPKIGTIAGSAVIDGKVIRGCFLRLLRDNRVIYEGKISSLKRFKEDVREVQTGFECGIGLENFNDLKLGDQFEAFIKEEVKDSL
ncbi:MAG: translation initiation factor IF-2, partial [Deltaproteobacteria bacterium]|nr:translation initiation factor IF-2 [Deltaproteobacteria bacterium]